MSAENRPEPVGMPCDRCGSPMFIKEDELRLRRHMGQEVLCSRCEQALRVLAGDVMKIVEEHAGLTPDRRRALEYLTDLAVNDPEKALKLRNLDERVESLHREVVFLRWAMLALAAVFGVIVAIFGVVVAILTT